MDAGDFDGLRAVSSLDLTRAVRRRACRREAHAQLEHREPHGQRTDDDKIRNGRFQSEAKQREGHART